MAGKHTPSPWRWDGEPGRSDLRHEGNPGAIDGCVLRHENYEGIWFARHNKDEDEANARLIAAAPELLEACRMIVEAASEDDPMAAGMLAGCAVTAAEAAIARATQPLPPPNEEV